ncbi:MAG: hypothetical protein JW839_03205 [Candidatus Lokiarchaeota archaeon]|nr:hypothetical protein [Candidatus Lokiarchaeota archaeon]
MVKGESIPWEKIEKQPDKEYKIRGKDVIEFRAAIEAQQSEIDNGSQAVKQLEAEKTSVEGALNAEKKRAADLERKVATLELDYKDKDAKARSKDAEMAKKVQELQETIAGLEGRGKQVEAERDLAKREIEAMARQIDAFKRDIGDLQARIVAIEAEKGELNTSLQEEKQRLEQQVHDIQEQRDAAIDKYLELEDAIKKPEIKLEAEDLATARACMTCKEYVLYKEGDYKYVKAVHLFDAVHRAHMVSTVTLSEVKNGYTPKTQEFIEKSAGK